MHWFVRESDYCSSISSSISRVCPRIPTGFSWNSHVLFRGHLHRTWHCSASFRSVISYLPRSSNRINSERDGTNEREGSATSISAYAYLQSGFSLCPALAAEERMQPTAPGSPVTCSPFRCGLAGRQGRRRWQAHGPRRRRRGGVAHGPAPRLVVAVGDVDARSVLGSYVINATPLHYAAVWQSPLVLV